MWSRSGAGMTPIKGIYTIGGSLHKIFASFSSTGPTSVSYQRLTPPDTLNVNQIYILPEYQGRGIGAACMTRIIDDANLEQKPVTLQVLKINHIRATALSTRGWDSQSLMKTLHIFR